VDERVAAPIGLEEVADDVLLIALVALSADVVLVLAHLMD
jgi:hypothetical protein